jgi:hypothetical protein
MFCANKAMKPEELRANLRGRDRFPCHALQARSLSDISGLLRNLGELLRHPVAAIVAVGGTGEMYSLTPSEHLRQLPAGVIL